MSGSPSGLVARGRAQALSQRNGRHVLSARAGKALQNPAYRPADADHEGFGVNSAGPLAIYGRPGHIPGGILCLAGAISCLYCWIIGPPRVRGSFLISVLSCIRTATALAVVAIVAAGCAAANNATSAQASNQGEQPYRTMYGISSEGTTTDLYTEFFGPRQPPPATNVAAAQPVQPVAAQPVTPAQQMAARSGPGAAGPSQVIASYRAPQPATTRPAQPAGVQVAQQPAASPAPAEPDVPAAYGITANGPTTDLFTELFGKRSSNQ